MKYYKVGTNQYKKRPHTLNNVWFLPACYLVFVGLALNVGVADQWKATFRDPRTMPLISPLADTKGVQNKEAPLGLKDYVYEIFGRKDGKIFMAILNAESHLNPKAHLITDREYSIGVAQINLKSQYKLVHWKRIPGDTLAEKQSWLENPFNSVLASFWIYEHSGFNAWSVYQNGNYLAYLE